MKAKTLLLILALGITISSFSQKATIELTFTAENNGQYVPLDSILIENLTQSCDTTLYTPDMILLLEYSLGINNTKLSGSSFKVSQNYPNPFKDKTTIILYLPDRENVIINITDIMGRALLHFERQLDRGSHAFTFYPGNEAVHFLTARVDNQNQTIKMFNSLSYTHGSEYCKLEYGGQQTYFNEFKSGNSINNFEFDLSDQLKYTAYSDLGNRTIIDAPTGDKTYSFQYGFGGIPCPGMSVIYDIDGNIYNTVQIGDQCWMKENLKTTTYQNGTPIPNVTDDNAWSNLTTGAYVWYDNDTSWKDKYGALYNWFATINANGLCPTGWHVPTNDEWTALTDYIGGTISPHGNELKSCRQVNSPLGGGCNTSEHPRWEEDTYYGNYGTDDYGFSGLPGGSRAYDGPFGSIGLNGYWWSSTEYSSLIAWTHRLFCFFGNVAMYDHSKQNGFSVRCLRD